MTNRYKRYKDVFFILLLGLALSAGGFAYENDDADVRPRDCAVRNLEYPTTVFHERVSLASSILEGCSALLRSDSLREESVELVKEIRQHARQIDDFAKDFPRRSALSPANEKE